MTTAIVSEGRGYLTTLVVGNLITLPPTPPPFKPATYRTFIPAVDRVSRDLGDRHGQQVFTVKGTRSRPSRVSTPASASGGETFRNHGDRQSGEIGADYVSSTPNRAVDPPSVAFIR